MVSVVEESATRCVTLPASPVLKASLKICLPPPMSLSMTEALPGEIPLGSMKAVVGPVPENGQNSVENNGHAKGRKSFVLGKNMHSSSLEITEPDLDDEVTGEKDAYMAGVLARYRKSLMEKTKFHLGAESLFKNFNPSN